MKREGRQRGMVRTYPNLPSPLNPRPGTRPVNQLNSPPTAGLFTKVPSKPTNHSRFTGKCGRPRCLGCHIHPAGKAMNKAKGAHKQWTAGVVANYRLFDWRVTDGLVTDGLNLSGASAKGILDHLLDDDDGYGHGRDDEKDDIDDASFRHVGIMLNDVEENEDWCMLDDAEGNEDWYLVE